MRRLDNFFLKKLVGYLNNVEETMSTIDKEGWLHTGDICYFDKNGYLYLIDRVKEIIKYNGFQVNMNMYSQYFFTFQLTVEMILMHQVLRNILLDINSIIVDCSCWIRGHINWPPKNSWRCSDSVSEPLFLLIWFLLINIKYLNEFFQMTLL